MNKKMLAVIFIAAIRVGLSLSFDADMNEFVRQKTEVNAEGFTLLSKSNSLTRYTELKTQNSGVIFWPIRKLYKNLENGLLFIINK